MCSGCWPVFLTLRPLLSHKRPGRGLLRAREPPHSAPGRPLRVPEEATRGTRGWMEPGPTPGELCHPCAPAALHRQPAEHVCCPCSAPGHQATAARPATLPNPSWPGGQRWQRPAAPHPPARNLKCRQQLPQLSPSRLNLQGSLVFTFFNSREAGSISKPWAEVMLAATSSSAAFDSSGRPWGPDGAAPAWDRTGFGPSSSGQALHPLPRLSSSRKLG